MILDPKYALDLPISYVKANILLDSIRDYSASPSRRTSGSLFSKPRFSDPVPCCILGRYTDVKAASSYVTPSAGLGDILSLPASVFPEEIRRTGSDFLQDMLTLSDVDNYWKSTPSSTGLTSGGKAFVRTLVKRHGLSGIAQVVGLSSFLA